MYIRHSFVHSIQIPILRDAIRAEDVVLQLGSIGVKPILEPIRVPPSRNLGGLDDGPDLVHLFLGQLDIHRADVFFQVLDLLGTIVASQTRQPPRQ